MGPLAAATTLEKAGAGSSSRAEPGSRLARLRARVRSIEGGETALGRGVASLGPALDRDLPWGGLPYAALHELAGIGSAGIAAGFARRFLGRKGALVWVRSDQRARRVGELYGPGLKPFGIAPAQLLHVRAHDEQEALWAAAEALRSRAVACTLVELDRLDLVASRKLQLAVEAGGGAGIILRGEISDPSPNAALTRFATAPQLALPRSGAGGGLGSGPSARRIRLSLWRAKGMAPAAWTVIWNEETLAFDLAPGLADRADGPGRRAAG